MIVLYDIHLDNRRAVIDELWKMGKVAVLGIVQSIILFIVGLKTVGIKVFLPGTHRSNLKNYNCLPIPSMSLW
jgi:hypothetical protein